MPERDLRVCFVGDSFVAGTGDSSALGWVGRIAAAGMMRGLPLTTYNLGVRRDTSVLVAERIEREVPPRLAPATDPRVVVSFGVNDTVVESGAMRVPRERTLEAWGRIRRRVGTARLLLVGPPAVDDDAQNARIEQLNEALRDASSRSGTPFVDAFAGTSVDDVWRREVREGDRFHPDAAGYARLAALLVEPVLAWLEEPGAD